MPIVTANASQTTIPDRDVISITRGSCASTLVL
jgi:hypothetical protein